MINCAGTETHPKPKRTLIKVQSGKRKEASTGYIIDYVATWYRDENGNKHCEFHDRPKIPYAIIKDHNSRDAKRPPMFINKDKVDIYECESDVLYREIANKVPNGMQYYNHILQTSSKGRFAWEMKDIQAHPLVYGSDMMLDDRIFSKFMAQNQAMTDYNIKICYYDIEVDLAEKGLVKDAKGRIGYPSFPSPEIAPCPVNLITLVEDNRDHINIHTFILENELNGQISEFKKHAKEKTEKIRQKLTVELKEKLGEDIHINPIISYFCKTELDLLKGFMAKVHEIDPDVMSAWNARFDYLTIRNRLKHLLQNNEYGWDADKLADFYMCDQKYMKQTGYTGNEIDIEPYTNYKSKTDDQFGDRIDECVVYDGINWLDQLLYYAALRKQFGALDSHKLDDIVQDEFGVNKLKFAKGITIKTAPWLCFDDFFEYNVRDSILLMMLSRKGGDYELLQSLAEMTQTAHPKVMKKTHSLKNFISKFAEERGYILSSNKNKNARSDNGMLDVLCGLDSRLKENNPAYQKLLTDKQNFGAIVADMRLLEENGINLYGRKSSKIFDNVTDMDLRSLYPSIILAFNLSKDTLVGKFYLYDLEIEENLIEKGCNMMLALSNEKQVKAYSKGDPIDLSIFLVDTLLTRDWIRVGEEFFNLPTVNDMLVKIGDRGTNNQIYSEKKTGEYRSFKSNWFVAMRDRLRLMYDEVQLSDSEMKELLVAEWNDRHLPIGRFYNTTTNENSEMTVEGFINKFLTEDLSMSGFGALFLNQNNGVLNILADAVQAMLDLRDYYKKEQKNAAHGSNEYNNAKRNQTSVKILTNSIYGVLSMAMSALYEMSVQNSITLCGQDIITCCIHSLEAFMQDNVEFNSEDDVFAYIDNILKQDYKYDILKYVDPITPNELIKYLSGKTINKSDTLAVAVNQMTPEQITKVYYKNQLQKLIMTPKIKQKLKSYVVNGKDSSFEVFRKVIVEFGMYDGFMSDRMNFLENHTRKSILVSDTDSAFLYTDPIIEQVSTEFGLDRTNDEEQVSIINLFMDIFCDVMDRAYWLYGEHSGLTLDDRLNIYMKNEFVYKRILVTENKKSYAGLITAELGKSIPPQVDIKGLSIKKSTASRKLRDTFVDILENDILKSREIDVLGVWKKYHALEQEIKDSLRAGDLLYALPKSVKDHGVYDNPQQQSQNRGMDLWNTIYPENKLVPPDKAFLIKMKDFKVAKEQMYKTHPTEAAQMEKWIETGIKHEKQIHDVKKFDGDIICVPITEDKIPECFIEGIDYSDMVATNMANGMILMTSLGLYTSAKNNMKKKSNIIML